MKARLVPLVMAATCLAWGQPGQSWAETMLFLDSEPGDYIGAGLQQTFTSADGSFVANRTFDGGVNISFSNFDTQPIHFWYTDFAAPFGQPLAPGAYEGATRWPFQADDVPGLSISGDGRGCNTLTGRFDVLEAVYMPGGAVLSFAADFEQHCEGGDPALFGSVRFNSCLAEPDGTPCGGGNLCLSDFTCQSGVCSGTPVTCTASDQCHQAGTCDPATGLCSNPIKPAGSPCDDGDPVVCSVPDQCTAGTCAPAGGGDSDGDGICNLDDNCPSDANPGQGDLDGDGEGNVCDPSDAALNLTRVRIRVGDRGAVLVKGDFFTTPPADTFDTTAGLSIAVADGLSFSHTYAWSADECETTPRGVLKCRSADRRSQATFIPLRQSPEVYRFRLRFHRLEVVGPLFPHVTARITNGNGVDRTGALDFCGTGNSGLKCPP